MPFEPDSDQKTGFEPDPNAGLAPPAGGPGSINMQEMPGTQSLALPHGGAGSLGPGQPEATPGMGKAGLMGLSIAAPMTPGLGLAGQSALMGLSGAAQSKLEGGSNKEALASGAFGAALGASPAIFPSTLQSKAGAALGAFTKQFGSKTINPTGPMTVVQEAAQSEQAGANLPKVLRNFIQRTNTAFPEAAEPLTIKEARLFASNASRQSASDTMSQNPNMQRLVGRFAAEMHNSIADASGVPNDYYSLLKNYANAKGYGNMVDAFKGFLGQQLKYAAAGTAAGAGGAAAYRMIKK